LAKANIIGLSFSPLAEANGNEFYSCYLISDSLPSLLRDGVIIKFYIGFSQTSAMSFVKIWVHLVFATKNREPFLKKEFRYDIYKHITENCIEKDIFLQAINGYHDHIHCLVSLGKDQSIAKISQLIKGESSFWINKNNLIDEKFSWQDDYFAVSVSESQLENVVNYIKNQEQHHSKKSFSEEVDEFMTKYGWQNVKE